MEKKTRVGIIDIMKGLCIIIVVMQHATLMPDIGDGLFKRACLCFHMPMFFFVTGLFLPVRKTMPQMLADRFNRLLVPWFVFALAGGLIVDILIRQNYDHLVHERAIMAWFVRGPNVPLYFLRALFVSTVVAYILARYCSSAARKCGVLPLLCVLSWASLNVSPRVDELPYYPQLAVDFFALREVAGMLMYMWIGHIVASLCTAGRMEVSRLQGLAVFIVASAALIAIDPPKMRWHYMQSQGDWHHITAAAICGITAIWGLSCALNRFAPLKIAGEYSLAILITHYLLIHGMMSQFGIDKPTAGWFTFLLLPPVVYAVRRWLPWACAQAPLMEWRDGRLRAAGWLSARINRIKSGIAGYFL